MIKYILITLWLITAFVIPYLIIVLMWVVLAFVKWDWTYWINLSDWMAYTRLFYLALNVAGILVATSLFAGDIIQAFKKGKVKK